MSKSKTQAWGEAHRREAVARSFELAAIGTRMTPVSPEEQASYTVFSNGGKDIATEDAWRAWLTRATWRNDKGAPWVDVDREVRRIRALAEGRLVREVGWRVDGVWYESAELLSAQRKAFRDEGRSVVRVTRIRRPK